MLSTNSKGIKRFAKSGLWQLHALNRPDDNLDAQICEVLSRLTSEVVVWHDLLGKFGGDMYCGIFLQSFNDEVGLKALTLQMLSDRGLKLELDIYEGSD